MRLRRRSLRTGPALAFALVSALAAPDPAATRAQSPPPSAKVDTEPLDLSPPERYQAAAVLEPVRRVTLVAAADGVLRSQDARAGASVRDGQEVAKLDAGEAAALLKIARAEARERAAAPAGGDQVANEVNAARLEAARARVELAQLQFDRCTLRAPFAGRVTASPHSDGQYLPKGAVVAEVADTSSLRAAVPVGRGGVAVGGSLALTVEGQPVTGKVQALTPLPAEFEVLRELASPYVGALVVVPNPGGALEPGQRVVNPALPAAPVATLPAQAVRKADPKSKDPDAATTVQVIRNDYVTDLKVRVLGSPAADRLQVTGAFRPTDALIVATNVPLLAGTLVRFNGQAAGADPAATAGEATAPRTTSRPAPIGPPGSALPNRPRPGGNRPAGTAPAPGSTPTPANAGGGSIPF